MDDPGRLGGLRRAPRLLTGSLSRAGSADLEDQVCREQGEQGEPGGECERAEPTGVASWASCTTHEGHRRDGSTRGGVLISVVIKEIVPSRGATTGGRSRDDR